MTDKIFPKSQLPIRKTSELLPSVFQTPANDKFLGSTLDPLTQPGVLEKTVGYVGKRYGKTFNSKDVYLDTDSTLRSRYQLDVGVTIKDEDKIENFYDYLDFKNILKFFGNSDERDYKVTEQVHYTWNPPIDWDKFINYREYYWEALFPPPVTVLGQSINVTSTYTVKLGTGSTYIFSPDGFTNNPTITLYRGQTYKFKINAPYDGLVIKTNYDTGSLLYNPNLPYSPGALVVFDGKLWRAKTSIRPDGSSIDIDSQDWEFVDSASSASALTYDTGVTNNGIENGTLTFTVPYDAPDVLYYQGKVNPDRFGKFLIADIEENTKINVELEVLGKETYTSSNGVVFTNGLVVDFRGQVTPSYFANDTWVIEGVGKAITLTKVQDLVPTEIPGSSDEVLFDDKGFDTQPFDNASLIAGLKDYITVARDSRDQNSWSRYNRWFHRSVLEYSYKLRGQDFPATESLRASRPIIEFNKDLQLFNHGYRSKTAVDFIDKFTKDVFSTIEGSLGYTIEGEPLFDGAKILVVADNDDLANNRIYQVKFITHNNRRQISLVKTEDSEPIVGDSVLIKRGDSPSTGGNRGLMYHFTTVLNENNEKENRWVVSQRKTKINQPPLFDAFDADGISFSDQEKYPTSTFLGTKLISYKIGNGPVDKELGFAVSYLNIDNVGDIQFDWNWDQDSFGYSIDREKFTKNIRSGYYKFNPDEIYANGWTELSKEYLQPILDSLILNQDSNQVEFSTVDWRYFNETTSIIKFYVNNQPINTGYQRNLGKFTFDQTFKAGDVIALKLITDQEPNEGYYEIPLGLEKNPLNNNLNSFTLGQAVDHITTSIEFYKDFIGKIPGVSNLRDLFGYQTYGKRFLKHAAPAPLAITLLCDKTINIVKSLQYAKKSYSEFKNSFLTKAEELNYTGNVADFVDEIIKEWSRSKTSSSPFSNSDMIGNGAYTSINYTVEDTGITTFSLSEKFNLTELSQRAVYLYLNNSQLLHERDYVFDPIFGFVRVLKTLNEGDQLEIREYISTAFNFIPPTPTALGLYKKYLPMKFEDDTYVASKEVIQGHDGSLIDAFGDYRDDVLLELEYRIYNNIKNVYDPSLFDIDKVAGGYYGNSVYDKPQVDEIVVQEFLKWIQNTSINYIDNGFYDSQNPFTYTYSNMTDPTETRRLPGHWRGVYKWFYDTDRPHSHPWEMLGFSEKPTWWENQYGAAPYTSENLLIWEDLRDGIIRQGDRAGVYDRYKRPSLLSHLPVDVDGNLIDPLSAGLAKNFSLINNTGPFKLGDEGPAEHAWRVTSEYPFAVSIAMCLLRPFEFISRNYDNSKVKFNKIGQLISNKTEEFLQITDLIDNDPMSLESGLVQYLKSYVRSKEISSLNIEKKLQGIDVALSHRLSGFVDKEQQRYLLDSKSPKSQTSSIFIPPENYDIIFNVSSPITTIAYSGVIIEKTDRGWIVKGYDDLKPYFNYFEAVPGQRDPIIQVGGVSETFKEWSTDTVYNNGELVRYRVEFYRSIRTHTSGEEFDINLWKRVPNVPLIGGVEAYKRQTFNPLSIKRLFYGTVLLTIQDVVDFLFGYESWLKSQGFIFDGYNKELGTTYDWTTSVKEFMFWTRQNWSLGSLIALSPISQKIKISYPVGVSDNLLDSFYEYRILRDDGRLLRPELIDVKRDFQSIEISVTDNANEGIYFFRTHYVLKEHVAVFSDRTVFNDIIYDKTTGYRQERMKVQGYRTVDWDGDYTSPGFLFDNVDIKVWQPFTDYKLGDIVSYQSFNWTSLENQVGVELFDNTKWSKLDFTPEKSLVANFDYRINQIEDYYNVAAEGLGSSQRMLARHAIGYQTREYLQNLAEDQVTQFRLYQGFIREKGTNNSIVKVFDKLSRSGQDSVELNEEWAFRIGKFGGADQYEEIEMELVKGKFQINPQPIVVLENLPNNVTEQNYNITSLDFTKFKNGVFETNINSLSLDAEPVKTAGYVKLDQVEHILKSKDDLLTYDINLVKENDHIWITFDKTSWTVLRFNEEPLLTIESIVKDGTTVTVTLTRRHQLQIGDIVGIAVENLTGFYKVVNNEVSSSVNSFEIIKESPGPDPKLDTGKINNLRKLTPVRFGSYNDLNEEEVALLNNNSRLWIDNNGDNRWEVVKKKKQYSSKTLLDSGIAVPNRLGRKVVYSETLKQSFVSDPVTGVVAVYSESENNLNIKQIISPPSEVENLVRGSFGEKMTLSPDNRFLVIAAPTASGIRSTFRGDLDKFLYYDNFGNVPLVFPPKIINANDIFLYRGKLWRSKIRQVLSFDGSTKIDVYSDDWEPAESIPVNMAGPDNGYEKQGAIFVYELVGQQWELKDSLLSPRPSAGEQFGSEIAIGVSGNNYYMAVSAIGSVQNTGRVYLYNFIENENLIQSFSGVLCNYTTNSIDFTIPHNYYTGQKVFYFNGTPEGNNLSEADQPPPPEPNTEFWIIRVDEFRIRLAGSVESARIGDAINLLDVGIDDSSSHTLVKEARPSSWRHLENQNYRGIYGEVPNNPTYAALSPQSAYYPKGSIVWSNEKLWEAQVDTFEDGSTLSVESNDWLEVSDIATQNSLPFNLFLGNDHSTLDLGLLSENQLNELVKEGDQFGTSLAMSRDGSILAVGAPLSDGQYFVNYKGIWRPDIEYIEGDVVKYFDEVETQTWAYYRLIDNRVGSSVVDSTVRSYGVKPGDDTSNDEFVWNNVGDSTNQSVGKVYVYQRSLGGVYRLKQTITTGNLSTINDLVENLSINVGDEFGYSIDIDYSGSTLVVSSPKADKNYLNQGSVYVFKTNGFANLEYRLKQKLESFEQYSNEYFGQDVKITPNTEKIVVGAKNSRYSLPTVFNTYEIYSDNRVQNAPYADYQPINLELAPTPTTFDQGKTKFADQPGFSGAVYIFELKDTKYFLTEKLETAQSPNESFGYSIDCSASAILVGSPEYITPAPHLAVIAYDGPITGTARLFYKKENVSSWEILSTQNSTVDISKIKSLFLYDPEKNIKIQDIDFIDPAKTKVLNDAEQEIKFKTPYDPAVYNIGTEDQVVDSSTAWAERHVGELWWDISKAKWIYYEQGDISYRVGNWSTLAEGSEVIVCEWVESLLLPSEWAALADTNEGIAEGISGQPLYPNNDVYTIKQLFNSSTGELTETKYFYWVKNKVTLPNNESRKISAASVTSLISNPIGSGKAFVNFISSNAIVANNFNSIVSSDKFYLNIQRYKNNINANEVHNEYVLMTENLAESLPPEKLENKWIDSLAGYDVSGNKVPNPLLNSKQKYGIEYRPRQGMFVDRLTALKIVVNKVNQVLETEPFADIIDFRTLNSKEEAPNEILREYDQAVDTFEDLSIVGVTRVRPAVLKANLLDGRLESVEIIDGGFGYRSKELSDESTAENILYVGPPVEIEGDGQGASAISIINSQGTIVKINVIFQGRKYSLINVKVRNFSVLVRNDRTLNNFWSIYAWDNVRQTFFRTKSQSFDTTRYWSYKDWWKSGYSPLDRIVVEISDISSEPLLNIKVGDLFRIKEFANGGWAVFEKISETDESFSDKYIIVARQNGTISLDESLYLPTIEGFGYDNTQAFDNTYYDLDSSKELRNILKAVKEDIFIGNYAVEWNKLFFASIKYVFAEQVSVDWAFKTSFLTATHNVGELEEKSNYKSDNLESFQEYINEVKPYRTTIREYLSKYNKVDTHMAASTDFDLPSVYSKVDGSLVTVNSRSAFLDSYPWKWWADNNGYSIISIEVFDAGTGYTTPPKVLIEGDGSGASARAFISNGEVSGVEVLTSGSNFSKAPKITLVGGTAERQARAVAIIGDGKARTFNITIKFDRYSKTSDITNFEFNQSFVASGFSAVFDLNYAPSRDKSKIKIIKQGQVVLPSEYNISFYQSLNDTYDLIKGRIIFITPPNKGEVIEVTYEKNSELFDAIARINKLYSPTSGMKNKELNQLMTGIDFGGVQIQGTTFDVTGGWDALPWFTDNWDSVEAAADFYYVVDARGDGSTTAVTLPYTPADGQIINIYLKRAGSFEPETLETDELTGQVTKNPPVQAPEVVRIDDPNYTDNWDSSVSTNPNAQMPTFVGDGVTNTIEIGRYIQTEPGDILIFRPIESDGSVTITDPNLLDTLISGGSLESTTTSQKVANNTVNGIYTTARGINADEIIIDGDKFISPDQVPAPEENVPGQVLDSLSIRIFHNTVSGSAPLHTRILYGDGVTRIFDIKSIALKSENILVYLDKEKCTTEDLNSPLLYSIDFRLNQIEFANAPSLNAVIEIITVGIGGISILEYREYVADGNQFQFVTGADYQRTTAVYATVNGEEADVGFTDTANLPEEIPDKTVVEFGFNPPRLSKVKVVCLGAGLDVDSTGISLVGVNSQTVTYDGVNRNIDIAGFVNLTRGSAKSSMLVEAGGRYLRGVDTNQYTLSDQYLVTVTSVVGTRQVYELPIGLDPNQPPGSILANNLSVYINDEPATFITDYVYDGVAKKIVVEQSRAAIGDIVRIENDLEAEYDIIGNNLVLRPSVNLQTSDLIEITWFNEYPSMKIVSDEYVGGKVIYKLLNSPLSASYVWVYKNNIRLTQDVDYVVSVPRATVHLVADSTVDDVIKIVVFGSSIFKLPSAFEMHKDMLNIYQFKRWSINNVELAQDLNYFDQQIVINDAENLSEPLATKNIPGVVYINGERIEYLKKQGNVLSQLRRGTFGTSIGEKYSIGSKVIDIGPEETLPYNEEQLRTDFISDGSTLIVGVLDFVPPKADKSRWYSSNFYTDRGVFNFNTNYVPRNVVEYRGAQYVNIRASYQINPTDSKYWSEITIPAEYGPCDAIEVFVSGQRLKKNPTIIYDEEISASSFDGDKIVEAEFTVDGVTAGIRLTNPVPAGRRISIIRKTGKIWKDRGVDSIQSGATLLENNTPIAKFIGQKNTLLPE